MALSHHRAQQLELLIRRLRRHQDLWGEDEGKEQRITRLLTRTKRRLYPYWERTRTDHAGQRLLQMYA